MTPSQDSHHHPELQFPIDSTNDTFRFHTMVKPSGSQCNIECSYCFYLHKDGLLDQPKMPRMSDEVLEEHIRQYIEAQTGDEVVFSWQGGEPTLMGLEFFERIVSFQQKYRKENQRIANDLQTNGIMLNEEWCRFLKKHDFLVGISIDGPANLHDIHRVSKGGQPTHERVMRAVSLLHKHDIPFASLCVVNRDNARRPIDVYRFLRDEVKAKQIQFIPCVEKADFTTVAPGTWNTQQIPVQFNPKQDASGDSALVTEWSVLPEDWGYFLNRVWDEWIKKDFGDLFIDQFENVVSMMFGYGSQKCVTAQICGKALAVEHNGDVFSCDHFVYPEYRLGNILETHEGDMAFSEQQQAFGFDKYKTLPDYCKQCDYLNLCWGNCPKDRFLKTPDGEDGLQYLCAGLKAFYKKATTEKSALAKRMGMR
jgi:uncharacterized protein